MFDFLSFFIVTRTLTELYTLLCLRLILRHIISRTSNKEQIEHLQSFKAQTNSGFRYSNIRLVL